VIEVKIRMRVRLWLLLVAVAACGPRKGPARAEAEGEKPPSFRASRVRSFTDTFAVTAVADTPSQLWIGTPHGLLRWEVTSGKSTVITSHDGLPEDRIAAVTADAQGGVWAATAKGVSRGLRGSWQNLPPPPVGDFVTGLVASLDGKILWAGGPEGLARWRGGKWERYFADLSVTALALQPNGTLWIGTSGKGVLRIARSADKVEAHTVAQGCEVDTVRGLAAVEKHVIAVGEGPAGPRAAWFDGDRFFSYEIKAPQVIEWAARAGGDLYLGAGTQAWKLAPAAAGASESALKLTALKVQPARAARSVALKAELPSSALDDPSPPKIDPKQTVPAAPQLSVEDAAFAIPDNVTAVGSSDRGLLLGTRFLGTVRVENGVVRNFRLADLAANAQRITVACKQENECYLATGGARAWKFDGRDFEVAAVDPEAGSRVLAVLSDGKGGVLAIHRGAGANELRVSTVEGGRWTPLSMQEVAVPNGPPELNFAELAPDGHLWVGLRYFDKESDPIDYGAAEIELESGKVIYHRSGKMDAKTTYGFGLPSDMVAMYWRGKFEVWFATRSGAARLLDGKVRVFTENDGMESELISDINTGPEGEVWVATRHGTGRFDGRRWSFPKMGPYYLQTSSLAHDDKQHYFLGTEKGVFCVGDCPHDGVDRKRGLLDDAVLDITVDPRGRVWALTAKGISIVEP
jgi:hypothetical protein